LCHRNDTTAVVLGLALRLHAPGKRIRANGSSKQQDVRLGTMGLVVDLSLWGGVYLGRSIFGDAFVGANFFFELAQQKSKKILQVFVPGA
jgi:hypothetical protein